MAEKMVVFIIHEDEKGICTLLDVLDQTADDTVMSALVTRAEERGVPTHQVRGCYMNLHLPSLYMDGKAIRLVHSEKR